jgi:hypothetical protein
VEVVLRLAAQREQDAAQQHLDDEDGLAGTRQAPEPRARLDPVPAPGAQRARGEVHDHHGNADDEMDFGHSRVL